MLLWYSIVHRDKNGTPSLAQAHTYVWACARAWITNLVFFSYFRRTLFHLHWSILDVFLVELNPCLSPNAKVIYLRSIQLQHSHQISVGQIGFPRKVVKQGARQDNDQWKEHGIVQWHFMAWLGNKGNDQGNEKGNEWTKLWMVPWIKQTCFENFAPVIYENACVFSHSAQQNSFFPKQETTCFFPSKPPQILRDRAIFARTKTLLWTQRTKNKLNKSHQSVPACSYCV